MAAGGVSVGHITSLSPRPGGVRTKSIIQLLIRGLHIDRCPLRGVNLVLSRILLKILPQLLSGAYFHVRRLGHVLLLLLAQNRLPGLVAVEVH